MGLDPLGVVVFGTGDGFTLAGQGVGATMSAMSRGILDVGQLPADPKQTSWLVAAGNSDSEEDVTLIARLAYCVDRASRGGFYGVGLVVESSALHQMGFSVAVAQARKAFNHITDNAFSTSGRQLDFRLAADLTTQMLPSPARLLTPADNRKPVSVRLEKGWRNYCEIDDLLLMLERHPALDALQGRNVVLTDQKLKTEVGVIGKSLLSHWQSKLFESLDEQLSSIRHKLDIAHKDQNALNASIGGLERRVETLKQEKADAAARHEARITELGDAVKSRDAEIEEARKSASSVEAQIKALNTELDSKTKEAASHLNEIESLETQLKELSDSAALKSKIGQLSAQIEISRRDHVETSAKLAKAQEECKELKRNHHALELRYSELFDANKDYQSAVKEAKIKIADQDDLIRDLNVTIRQLKGVEQTGRDLKPRPKILRTAASHIAAGLFALLIAVGLGIATKVIHFGNNDVATTHSTETSRSASSFAPPVLLRTTQRPETVSQTARSLEMASRTALIDVFAAQGDDQLGIASLQQAIGATSDGQWGQGSRTKLLESLAGHEALYDCVYLETLAPDLPERESFSARSFAPNPEAVPSLTRFMRLVGDDAEFRHRKNLSMLCTSEAVRELFANALNLSDAAQMNRAHDQIAAEAPVFLRAYNDLWSHVDCEVTFDALGEGSDPTATERFSDQIRTFNETCRPKDPVLR